MKFTPKTEEQIIEELLLPEGFYPFEVMSAMNWESQQGNKSIRLTLKITNTNEKSPVKARFVNDYLTSNIYGLRKTLHFCKMCGLMDEYNNGELTYKHFEEKSGELYLVIQRAKQVQFEDQNVVKDYISKNMGMATAKSLSDEPMPDDEIPF